MYPILKFLFNSSIYCIIIIKTQTNKTKNYLYRNRYLSRLCSGVNPSVFDCFGLPLALA
ncbi:hypothetical protein Hanom_Chr04g00342241 [Helianthus anomalus]